MIDNIKAQLKKSLPGELVDNLMLEYEKLKDNFVLDKHEPSELNAGKYCEVVLRIIQNQTDPAGNYTPLTSRITNFLDVSRNFENLPGTINDTLRLHIPRVIISLYNIRNHRGVGHIGGDINPNISDSTFLTSGCDWVMAELIRLFYACSITDAEKLVKQIVKRKIPFIHEIRDRKRVLSVKKYENKILLLLLEKYPDYITDRDLFRWTEHSHSSTFKALLAKLHKLELIDYHKGNCTLTPIGVKVAEDYLLKNSLL